MPETTEELGKKDRGLWITYTRFVKLNLFQTGSAKAFSTEKWGAGSALVGSKTSDRGDMSTSKQFLSPSAPAAGAKGAQDTS